MKKLKILQCITVCQRWRQDNYDHLPLICVVKWFPLKLPNKNVDCSFCIAALVAAIAVCVGGSSTVLSSLKSMATPTVYSPSPLARMPSVPSKS